MLHHNLTFPQAYIKSQELGFISYHYTLVFTKPPERTVKTLCIVVLEPRWPN